MPSEIVIVIEQMVLKNDWLSPLPILCFAHRDLEVLATMSDNDKIPVGLAIQELPDNPLDIESIIAKIGEGKICTVSLPLPNVSGHKSKESTECPIHKIIRTSDQDGNPHIAINMDVEVGVLALYVAANLYALVPTSKLE